MVSEVRESMGAAPVAPEKKQPQTKGATIMAGSTMTVAEVLAKHDIIGMALQIVGAVDKGTVITDETLRKELNLGADRWRRARGSVRLSEHWTSLPDKSIVWGRKETVRSLEERIKEIQL